jgi:hypothetical protein
VQLMLWKCGHQLGAAPLTGCQMLCRVACGPSPVHSSIPIPSAPETLFLRYMPPTCCWFADGRELNALLCCLRLIWS